MELKPKDQEKILEQNRFIKGHYEVANLIVKGILHDRTFEDLEKLYLGIIGRAENARQIIKILKGEIKIGENQNISPVEKISPS